MSSVIQGLLARYLQGEDVVQHLVDIAHKISRNEAQFEDLYGGWNKRELKQIFELLADSPINMSRNFELINRKFGIDPSIYSIDYDLQDYMNRARHYKIYKSRIPKGYASDDTTTVLRIAHGILLKIKAMISKRLTEALGQTTHPYAAGRIFDFFENNGEVDSEFTLDIPMNDFLIYKLTHYAEAKALKEKIQEYLTS